MPEISAAAIEAAERAIIDAADDFGTGDDVSGSRREFARVALEAAAPILAEAWKPKPRARTPKREVLPRCQWCFKHNRTASEYEQQGLNGVWHRLCVRCANKRLGNPWNALLRMRKIGSEVNDSAPAGAVKEDGGP